MFLPKDNWVYKLVHQRLKQNVLKTQGEKSYLFLSVKAFCCQIFWSILFLRLFPDGLNSDYFSSGTQYDVSSTDLVDFAFMCSG